MIEIKGQYNKIKCFCKTLESSAKAQLQSIADRPEFAESKIRIMPDVHAGMGCTIGTTMTIHDKISPGMVGVDIGCGMETVRIVEKEMDFAKLDRLIRSNIPCGREVRKTEHVLNDEINLDELHCARKVNLTRARLSIGTLGGGNHFIEVCKDEVDNLYIVIHSGSRHLGHEVCSLYQKEGFKALCGNRPPIPKQMAYVEGMLFDEYIDDMKLVQKFATLNRKAMMDVILEGMGLTAMEVFTTIHNYIDTKSMILRKGAVSALEGQKLLIPINMRDGSLICIGKGNPDWNYSAPHGAGRLMSRRDAFKNLSMNEYISEMAEVYTTCVIPDTLDEAPMAYKDADEIIEQIEPTATIINRIKPLYNFKAAD